MSETPRNIHSLYDIRVRNEKFNAENDTRGTRNFEVIKQQGKELRGNEYRRELAELH